MSVIALTNHQIDLLYEASEWHHKWYAVYYIDPPSFDILLEMNHRKLTYMFENQEVDIKSIDVALYKMLDTYKNMFLNYS